MNKQNLSRGFERSETVPSQPSPWGKGTVEAALHWAFQVEAAGRAMSGRVGPMGYRSAWGGIAQHAALGVAVDCSGGAGEGGHDLAEWIAERVAALPGDVGALVYQHAKAGTRPALCEQAPRMVPILGAGGRHVVVYHDLAKRRPAYCPVRESPLAEERDYARAAWRVWWDALDLLAVQVGADPLADPREPWDEKRG